MAKTSDIIKAMIDKETLSKNKYLIMWALAALGGWTGSAVQFFSFPEKIVDNSVIIKQPTVKQPAKKEVTIIYSCDKKLRQHEQIIHGERE